MQQPDFMSEDYRLARLFNIVKDFVLASGGDGKGWIVSPRYRVLADKFVDKWFAKREEPEGYIAFSHEQEAIMFTDLLPDPPYILEIVVDIP